MNPGIPFKDTGGGLSRIHSISQGPDRISRTSKEDVLGSQVLFGGIRTDPMSGWVALMLWDSETILVKCGAAISGSLAGAHHVVAQEKGSQGKHACGIGVSRVQPPEV